MWGEMGEQACLMMECMFLMLSVMGAGIIILVVGLLGRVNRGIMKQVPVAFTRIIVTLVVGVAQVMLGLRFLLRFLGAGKSAPFARWVYVNSQSLVAPFEGIFPTTKALGLFSLDFSTLFGLMVYSVVGYVVLEVLDSFERSGS